jgi:hypothetical protein
MREPTPCISNFPTIGNARNATYRQSLVCSTHCPRIFHIASRYSYVWVYCTRLDLTWTSLTLVTKRSRLTIRRPTISTAPFWLRRRKRGKACHFWKKAKNLGVVNADYWLGLSYVSVGEKAKAIENLENYTKRVPGDQNAARILDAVRHDNVKFEQPKGPREFCLRERSNERSRCRWRKDNPVHNRSLVIETLLRFNRLPGSAEILITHRN